MKWWEKMKQKIKEPEKNARLDEWKARYEDAKTKYADELAAMETRDGYYNGTRAVKANPNKREEAKKLAINVRNICFELIESEVDSSIPMPKVRPIHKEDEEQAKIIEKYLTNQVEMLDFNGINDMQERTTPIQGGSFSLVEWDNTKGLHCTIGDVTVTDIHPRQVIPQPGVSEIEKMDYVFVRDSQTKDYVKRRFGVSVETEEETDREIREEVQSDELVTVITAYYKNKNNGIGRYRWCGDVELENLEDYEARHLTVCKECGKTKESDVCECGCKTFVERNDEMDRVPIFHEEQVDVRADGTPYIINVAEFVEVPFYKPNAFPVVMRKNISRDKKFLGFSDIDVIEDQQDSIKKYGSKINEKLLTGGSYVTLPNGIGVETTDAEMKIIRVDNPAQKALIDVITAQADTTQDRIALELNYSWAKSSLGITDAYQGKYDGSATSGTAKQYSINQAAGRLESKRVMKNRAYAKMYELMFKFALAYADQPIPITSVGQDGELEFSHFDKTMFLKKDSTGTWYWNDEFIFAVDPTSTLMMNREAMWAQADMKLQNGAFGTLGSDETNYLYWLEQERNGYPNAGEIKKEIEARIQRAKEAQNEMPIM